MDGPRNYHAKWNQSDNETPTANAITDMWHLKKGHDELLCKTDSDLQTLQNLWFPNETGSVVGGRTGGLGWICCKIWLWWLLYTNKCNKIHWVIKKENLYFLAAEPLPLLFLLARTLSKHFHPRGCSQSFFKVHPKRCGSLYLVSWSL